MFKSNLYADKQFAHMLNGFEYFRLSIASPAHFPSQKLPIGFNEKKLFRDVTNGLVKGKAKNVSKSVHELKNIFLTDTMVLKLRSRSSGGLTIEVDDYLVSLILSVISVGDKGFVSAYSHLLSRGSIYEQELGCTQLFARLMLMDAYSNSALNNSLPSLKEVSNFLKGNNSQSISSLLLIELLVTYFIQNINVFYAYIVSEDKEIGVDSIIALSILSGSHFPVVYFLNTYPDLNDLDWYGFDRPYISRVIAGSFLGESYVELQDLPINNVAYKDLITLIDELESSKNVSCLHLIRGVVEKARPSWVNCYESDLYIDLISSSVELKPCYAYVAYKALLNGYDVDLSNNDSKQIVSTNRYLNFLYEKVYTNEINDRPQGWWREQLLDLLTNLDSKTMLDSEITSIISKTVRLFFYERLSDEKIKVFSLYLPEIQKSLLTLKQPGCTSYDYSNFLVKLKKMCTDYYNELNKIDEKDSKVVCDNSLPLKIVNEKVSVELLNIKSLYFTGVKMNVDELSELLRNYTYNKINIDTDILSKLLLSMEVKEIIELYITSIPEHLKKDCLSNFDILEWLN
ncbi:hypothetical protein [Photobacterium leiognathi]|uniref:hypothetical protein n=1 Tax=Photobacterium leiognathi TaxID=553611 RepID=UPI002981AD2C|nr:hypothetical protein [Photobacterium leiognathi]